MQKMDSQGRKVQLLDMKLMDIQYQVQTRQSVLFKFIVTLYSLVSYLEWLVFLRKINEFLYFIFHFMPK